MENANLFWQSGTENSKRIVGLGGSAQLLGLVEAEAETAARRQRDVARNTGVRSKGFSVCMRRCRPPPTANYSPGPEAQQQPGVPKGMHMLHSRRGFGAFPRPQLLSAALDKAVCVWDVGPAAAAAAAVAATWWC